MTALTPVIVEVALNGVTPKRQNELVPITPDEVADDALRCLAAGASIAHSHSDVVGVDGDTAAARYLEAYQPVLAKQPDALLYPTTNFGPGVEAAYAHACEVMATSALTEDGREMMRAFLEKRPAVYPPRR